jgi:hypothetical protein
VTTTEWFGQSDPFFISADAPGDDDSGTYHLQRVPPPDIESLCADPNLVSFLSQFPIDILFEAAALAVISDYPKNPAIERRSGPNGEEEFRIRAHRLAVRPVVEARRSAASP